MDYYKNQTYYDVLGISENASFENIERAKNRLKFEERVPFSMWEKIDEAYSILSDKEKRKEYDKSLKIIDSNDEITHNVLSNNGVELSVKDEIHSNSDHTSSSILDESDEIYSNSDHTSSSIVNEDEQSLNNSSKYKVNEKIILPKKINLRKENFSSILSDETYFSIIEDIQTEERNIINLYSQKIEEQILNLLSSPHNNIELEKNRIRYENQIELLKEMIEIRKSARKKENELSKSDLRLLALKYELYLQKFKLKNINKKIEEYNNSNEVSKVSEELSQVNKEILKTDEKFSIKNIKFVKNIMGFSSKKYKVVKEKIGSFINETFGLNEPKKIKR